MAKNIWKLGIVSDAHGNLPALKAIVDKFRKLGCDGILHAGDMIDLGPFSAECAEELFRLPKAILLKGNHEMTYLNGVERCQKKLTEEEKAHYRYVYSTMGDRFRKKIASLPMSVTLQKFGYRFAFLHYPFCNGRFCPIEYQPTAEKFDRMFKNIDADVIFFGHEHVPCEIRGRTQYVGIGSLGCNGSALAKGILLTVTREGFRYERVETPYPKEELLNALKTGKIPNEEFIRKNYFGVDRPEQKDIR